MAVRGGRMARRVQDGGGRHKRTANARTTSGLTPALARRVGELLIRLPFKTHDETPNGQNGSLAGEETSPSTLRAYPTTPSRELATSPSKSVWMAPGREAGRLLAERVSGEGELSASLLALV